MAGFNVNGKNIGESTRKPKKALKEEIFEILFNDEEEQKKKEINKKILISGMNGTAKSSLSLALATYDLKEDEVIIYVDIDNSGFEIVQEFYFDHYQNRQIRIYNPDKTHEVNGITVKDEEKVVGASGSAAQSIKDAIAAGYKIKAVIVDGISFLLEYCESIMRIDKDKAADEGISMGAWKIRNKAFRDFSSPYMALPVPVIFVSHEDFIREIAEDEGKKFASVKQRFIDECSVRMVLEKRENNNPDITDYYAVIKKNRSDVTKENQEFKFMSINRKTENIDFDATDLTRVIFPTIGDTKDVEKQ